MTLKMADKGDEEVLTAAKVRWVAGAAVKLHLFKNDYTPTTADTIANYTESTFPGYAAASANNWQAPTTAAHVSSMLEQARTFTRNATGATENVYGYYVTDNASANLFWAERDPAAPIPLTNNGDSYTVTLRLTAQDLST